MGALKKGLRARSSKEQARYGLRQLVKYGFRGFGERDRRVVRTGRPFVVSPGLAERRTFGSLLGGGWICTVLVW